MPVVRHIIVCEGESEWAYLQRLQSFFDAQPLAGGDFETPLRVIVSVRGVAKNGSFGALKRRHSETRKDNRKAFIQIWADFDLYQRNDHSCADHYKGKPGGIPDFWFSFYNFEDFFALHSEGARFHEWLQFGDQGHFTVPLHANGYLPEITRIFPDYRKGELPADFITWDALKNLKHNRVHQPSSNPHNLQSMRAFADFLVHEIECAYPGSLD